MGAMWVNQYARSLIGSHYLWGSAGATPNGHDGAWYRLNSVGLEPSSLDAAKPTVFAASCDVDGHFVCAGNFNKLPGGRYADPRDWDLKNYLDMLGRLGDESFWYPYYSRFTPRVVKGKNVSNNNLIVWGEDCRYVRHFDCIGFVNHVLSQTTNPQWHYSIQQYSQGAGGLTPVPLSDPPADGDILTRGVEHIGFLCADGHVVQAEEHSTGVHGDEIYRAARWDKRLRIPQSVYWF